MVMYITLDKGTMFGGKSSELCKLHRQYSKKKRYISVTESEKLRLLVIKHGVDTRYDGSQHIVTHDKKKIPCARINRLLDINPYDWDVIIIDEGQFFPDLYDWISKHFSICNTRVHVAGLNGDKNQGNFGDINRISPFCSEERIHYGMCAVCGEKAPFTKYRGDSVEQTVVGGDDDYYTVCHRHLDISPSEIEKYVDYSSDQ